MNARATCRAPRWWWSRNERKGDLPGPALLVVAE